MGKEYNAPPAPDPLATANAQTQMNTDTARLTRQLNSYDEIAPGYRVTYQPIPVPTLNQSGLTTLKSAGPLYNGSPLSATNFNSDAYLAANPDIAEALATGNSGYSSAYDQWNKTGRNEPTRSLGFNVTNPTYQVGNGIDPYAGLSGGKNQFDTLRRQAGYTGDFGNNAFENWLGRQEYDTRANYVNALIGAGADPDYIDREISGLPDPSTLQDRYRRIVELDPAQQQLFNAQTGIQNAALGIGTSQVGRVGQALSNPLSTVGLPELIGSVMGLGSVGGNQDLANGRIDPYGGLDQGTFDELRRGLGFTDQFGDNRFEDWLSAQPGDVKSNYIAQLRAAGADPDYLSQLGATSDPMAALGEQRRLSETALLNRAEPQLARARARAQNDLLNRGIPRGSQAWKDAMDDIARQEDDVRNSISAQATNDMVQQFGLAAQNAQLSNSARSQGLQERAYLGNTPINQLSALLGLGQVALPQATIAAPQVNINPADYQGAVYNTYNGQLNAANARAANSNAMWGNIFGLGGTLGAAAILSDRRTKKEIRRIGTLDNGLPVYAFRYKSGGPVQIGLMAQEVESVRPDAVTTINGLKHVNYALAVG